MQSFISLRASRESGYFLLGGYAASLALATLLMGPTGLVAGLLFLPAIAFHAVRTRPPKIEDVSPEQRHDFMLGCLSRHLGDPTHPTVALIIDLDSHDTLRDLYGKSALDRALSITQSVVEECLTPLDVTVHLSGGRFMSALAPQAPHDSDAMLNTCARIQHALAYVPHTTQLPIHLSLSIGFAASDSLARPTAEALHRAALSALSEAKQSGPANVRGYCEAIAKRRSNHKQFARAAQDGFEREEIIAHFQPQLDLQTGAIVGLEALARWRHPHRGILPPDQFLPSLEHSGLTQSLNKTILRQALTALRVWDEAGFRVPTIAVNLSGAELRDPYLVERVALALEKRGIAPARLTFEVVETLAASVKDVVVSDNLAALADLGCLIELEEFGTGYASIENITRFGVKRIKIDQTFISSIDRNPTQQDMASHLISMADRLGLRTLADGVETAKERSVLSQLGCGEAQGFLIAQPMPMDETLNWMKAHSPALYAPAELARQAG